MDIKQWTDNSYDVFVIDEAGDLSVRNTRPGHVDGRRVLVMSDDMPAFIAWLKETTNG